MMVMMKPGLAGRAFILVDKVRTFVKTPHTAHKAYRYAEQPIMPAERISS